jgi:tRNA(Ile)-lysidine synthase
VNPSHPPSLLTLARRALLEECGVERGSSLLIAVSGGTDSTALLHVLALLQPKLRLSLHACGVDHGLRPEASAELGLAAGLAHDLGIAFERVELQLRTGANLQARARDARYEALERVREVNGLDAIATAHQADDRAETVLIRLLRGAPADGLAVLPARSGTRVRPLLRAGRADVLRHLERHRLPHATDPSNRDARFLRVRVRHEVLPLLTALSPAIVSHLCALADELGGPPLPEVRDETGARLLLGKSQRRELGRALRDRSARARVLLKGGRILRLSPSDGRPEIEEAPKTRWKTPKPSQSG